MSVKRRYRTQVQSPLTWPYGIRGPVRSLGETIISCLFHTSPSYSGDLVSYDHISCVHTRGRYGGKVCVCWGAVLLTCVVSWYKQHLAVTWPVWYNVSWTPTALLLIVIGCHLKRTYLPWDLQVIKIPFSHRLCVFMSRSKSAVNGYVSSYSPIMIAGLQYRLCVLFMSP